MFTNLLNLKNFDVIFTGQIDTPEIVDSVNALTLADWILTEEDICEDREFMEVEHTILYFFNFVFAKVSCRWVSRGQFMFS